MADDFKAQRGPGGKITGYKGKEAGKDYKYVEPKKPTGPAIGDVAPKSVGTEPMPKQKDYATTAEFADAMRKWRDRQRTATEGANALGAKKE